MFQEGDKAYEYQTHREIVTISDPEIALVSKHHLMIAWQVLSSHNCSFILSLIVYSSAESDSKLVLAEDIVIGVKKIIKYYRTFCFY